MADSPGQARVLRRVGVGRGFVASDLLPTLLEPFHRQAERSRAGEGEGAGLGLAIVAAIVRAHEGRLVLRSRDDGGLLVEVELRAAPHRR